MVKTTMTPVFVQKRPPLYLACGVDGKRSGVEDLAVKKPAYWVVKRKLSATMQKSAFKALLFLIVDNYMMN